MQKMFLFVFLPFVACAKKTLNSTQQTYQAPPFTDCRSDSSFCDEEDELYDLPEADEPDSGLPTEKE